jgi:hypothetical protein
MSRSGFLAAFRSPRLIALLVLAGFATVLAASTTERASLWRDRDIVVDGQDAEWHGLTLPVKNQHFSLGVVNDADYLYVCLPVMDAQARMLIERRGLAVWLDKAGGKKNQFGVHFPVYGIADARAGRGRGEGPAGDRQGSDGRGPMGGPIEIGILGPGLGKGRIMLMADARGIEVSLGVYENLLVYELRVPLKRSEEHPYAPDVKPGDTLRVQFETPSVPPGRAPLGGAPGAPPGGVVVSGGGGRGGPAGVGVSVGVGGPPIGSPDMLPPIDVAMNVRLAKGPEK